MRLQMAAAPAEGRGAGAGGGGGAGSARSTGLKRSGSLDAQAAGLETDEEFERAIGSYDVREVADALRRYLAFELQTRCALCVVDWWRYMGVYWRF